MNTYRLTGNGLDSLCACTETIGVPGPGEVQLNIKATAINNRDVGVIEGAYSACGNLVPLSDASGVVGAIGEGVDAFAIGDEVISCFYVDWPSGRATAENHRYSFGRERDGFLRLRMNVPVTGLVAKPKTLTHAEGATLPCAALTAWTALFREGGLEPGQHVVIEGTGGVAIFALQFAKMAGASVTVLSSSDAKLERAAALGADHCVNYRKTPVWSDLITEVTNGRGADIVVELGGTETLGQALKSIRVGGLVAIIGVLSGIEANLFLPDMLERYARLQGVTVGHREDMMAMGRAIDFHGIKPVIERLYAFDRATDAFADLPKGEHFGKLVIDHSL